MSRNEIHFAIGLPGEKEVISGLYEYITLPSLVMIRCADALVCDTACGARRFLFCFRHAIVL